MIEGTGLITLETTNAPAPTIPPPMKRSMMTCDGPEVEGTSQRHQRLVTTHCVGVFDAEPGSSGTRTYDPRSAPTAGVKSAVHMTQKIVAGGNDPGGERYGNGVMIGTAIRASLPR